MELTWSLTSCVRPTAVCGPSLTRRAKRSGSRGSATVFPAPTTGEWAADPMAVITHRQDEGMTGNNRSPVLKDAKALVVGVANQHSIAYGCAKAFRELGAEVALTYINEKTKSYTEPLA